MSLDLKNAQQLLEEVKTNLCELCNCGTVEDLSEVCAVFAKTYGEDAVECAEPFLLYGKALLEMSKIESILLDNEEVESEEDSEEDEPEEEEDKPDGDDVGHLELAWEVLELAKELAWEVLELAKNISEKHGKTEIEAEAWHYLGEVSLENNNYPQAIEDLAKSVTIKTKVDSADSRSLAETHFQLGVAYAWSGEWTKAEASLTAAISALTARIASHSSEKEALENIVHEIKTRIADLKDMEKGVYTNPYVTVPCGKITIGSGVAGAIDAAKVAGLPTVGTA